MVSFFLRQFVVAFKVDEDAPVWCWCYLDILAAGSLSGSDFIFEIYIFGKSLFTAAQTALLVFLLHAHLQRTAARSTYFANILKIYWRTFVSLCYPFLTSWGADTLSSKCSMECSGKVIPCCSITITINRFSLLSVVSWIFSQRSLAGYKVRVPRSLLRELDRCC